MASELLRARFNFAVSDFRRCSASVASTRRLGPDGIELTGDELAADRGPSSERFEGSLEGGGLGLPTLAEKVAAIGQRRGQLGRRLAAGDADFFELELDGPELSLSFRDLDPAVENGDGTLDAEGNALFGVSWRSAASERR